jgi:ubiquinone/menaquinone biosynthesis C-methylase UbiE
MLKPSFSKKHTQRGLSIFERAKVSKSIAFIVENLKAKDVCIDVGCGTGFVTSFELPHFRMVIATDISREMLRVAKHSFKNVKSLNFLVCDADFLPLRSNVTDMASISSVLHHLPKPSFTLR